MLTVSDDPTAIVRVLDRFVAADPVRYTMLGTLRSAVCQPDAAPWSAGSADGHALAVRSHRTFPVLLASSWQPAVRAELAGLLRALPELAGIGGTQDEVAPLAGLVLGGGARRKLRQRLFRLDELTGPSGVPAEPAARTGTTAAC